MLWPCSILSVVALALTVCTLSPWAVHSNITYIPIHITVHSQQVTNSEAYIESKSNYILNTAEKLPFLPEILQHHRQFLPICANFSQKHRPIFFWHFVIRNTYTAFTFNYTTDVPSVHLSAPQTAPPHAPISGPWTEPVLTFCGRQLFFF